MSSEPKFKTGQIVIMNGKKNLPFRIIDTLFNSESGEWFYAWNRKNYAAEHMIRELTPEETGRGDETENEGVAHGGD